MSKTRYVDITQAVTEKQAARAFLHHLHLAIAYWEACDDNCKIEKEIQYFPSDTASAANALHRELKRIYGE